MGIFNTLIAKVEVPSQNFLIWWKHSITVSLSIEYGPKYACLELISTFEAMGLNFLFELAIGRYEWWEADDDQIISWSPPPYSELHFNGVALYTLWCIVIMFQKWFYTLVLYVIMPNKNWFCWLVHNFQSYLLHFQWKEFVCNERKKKNKFRLQMLLLANCEASFVDYCSEIEHSLLLYPVCMDHFYRWKLCFLDKILIMIMDRYVSEMIEIVESLGKIYNFYFGRLMVCHFLSQEERPFLHPWETSTRSLLMIFRDSKYPAMDAWKAGLREVSSSLMQLSQSSKFSNVCYTLSQYSYVSTIQSIGWISLW